MPTPSTLAKARVSLSASFYTEMSTCGLAARSAPLDPAFAFVHKRAVARLSPRAKRPSTSHEELMSAFKPLVFSGVQPTGNLHLGNYLGAIKKFVALQEQSDCIYCVVDMHSLTAQLVYQDLGDQTRSITAAFLASGIDPKKHIVFNQSRVIQHAELAWIFNCLSRINLTDDADTISRKVRKAKTDPEALPSELRGLESRPEAENLIGIYAGLAEILKADVLKEYGDQQFSVFKPALADLAVEKLAPIASEMRRIEGDRAYVDAVLRDGADRARAIAEGTMKTVRDIVGLLQD